jgi:hypothetical protein
MSRTLAAALLAIASGIGAGTFSATAGASASLHPVDAHSTVVAAGPSTAADGQHHDGFGWQ